MIVFLHPAVNDYVGVAEDGETWWQWPAEHEGWARKRRCAADLHQHCEELPADLARLALRLSGGPE
jgi:hypothetical protein